MYSFTFLCFRIAQVYFYYVMDHNETPYNEALTHFYPIYSRVDIDSIGAEYGDVAHIKVVENS